MEFFLNLPFYQSNEQFSRFKEIFLYSKIYNLKKLIYYNIFTALNDINIYLKKKPISFM